MYISQKALEVHKGVAILMNAVGREVVPKES